MDVAIVIAIISAIASIIVGVLQLRLWKSQAKKTDVEAYTELIKTASAKTESDMLILKGVNIELNNYIAALQLRIAALEKEKIEIALATKKREEDFINTITELDARLENCERKLRNQGV